MFQSTTTTLGAVLVLELFFDKVYVCIVVFLRPDIISDFTLDISSQIFRHIGLLLPAVLTISDIRDAVALVDHVAGVLHHRRRAGIPESTIASLRKMHEKKYTRSSNLVGRRSNNINANVLSRIFTNVRHSAFLGHFAFLFTLVLLGSFGLFLCIYATWSFNSQAHSCRQKLGVIALCAFPRLYYRNGFFAPTTCAWENVSSLDCRGKLSSSDVRAMSWLPDAEAEYASMKRLTSIDVSHSEFLQNFPVGWACS